jgi:hypothetical protein
VGLAGQVTHYNNNSTIVGHCHPTDWSPAKRSIIREWQLWKKNPASADADTAFGEFYLHLQRQSAQLLMFPSDDYFKTVRE